MHSTISLFRHLYDHLPPLVPEETVAKMKHALEHLESDPTITLTEIEETMVAFGYQVWPWNQAYKEFLAIAEGQVGEHFLLPKLSPELQEKYSDFKTAGGTLRDLHSGRPADFFSSEERVELCHALVEMGAELREYVGRELVGLGRKKYLQKVEEFAAVLEKIEDSLNTLRALAEAEQDHPNLANEIRARIKGFEHGLCLLAPEPCYEAVCQSVDFFHGRKQDLNRMRGIHVPVEVDFYGVE